MAEWQRDSSLLSSIARWLLKLGGWTLVGEHPDVPKAVIIAAPHTSNWDGFWAICYKVYARLDIRWFVKDSMFWFPLNVLLRIWRTSTGVTTPTSGFSPSC